MSKYDDTKFYWLQLKEDFFEEDSIAWLEEQENGEKYALFYLKLCLKSLKTKGVLIRKVGNILVPYDKAKLAEITRMDVDTVVVAMELLKKIGLIKILKDGEIYCTQVAEMIGEKSMGAFKKQQQRLLSSKNNTGRQEADIRPPELEIELELEQEIEVEEEKEATAAQKIEDVFIYFEKNIGTLTQDMKNSLKFYSQKMELEVIKKIITEAITANAKNWNYIKKILDSCYSQEVYTIKQFKDRQEQFKKQKTKNNNSYQDYDQRSYENLNFLMANKPGLIDST